MSINSVPKNDAVSEISRAWSAHHSTLKEGRQAAALLRESPGIHRLSPPPPGSTLSDHPLGVLVG